MPCNMCVHYLSATRDPASGLCRLKSDSTGIPHETAPTGLCEFFDVDPGRLDELQMALCRHCGAVAFISGEIELCEPCLTQYNIQQFFRDEGAEARSVVRFNCSRPFRERWLRHRLEVKQGGKRA